MKTYKVVVVWEVCGEIEVRANNLQKACNKVEADNNIALPKGNYVDESVRVDREMSEYLNKGLFDGHSNME